MAMYHVPCVMAMCHGHTRGHEAWPDGHGDEHAQVVDRVARDILDEIDYKKEAINAARFEARPSGGAVVVVIHAGVDRRHETGAQRGRTREAESVSKAFGRRLDEQ